MFPRLFGAVSAPAMIDGLLPLAERWQPDVVLHETGELAAPIVAARLGVPHITHAFGSPVPEDRLASAAEFVAPLWHQLGFDVPAVLRRVRPPVPRHLPAEVCSFREDTHVRNDTPLRPVFWTPPFSDTSSWQPDVVHPRIYVTFGTVFNEPGAVFDNAVHAAGRGRGASVGHRRSQR